MNFFASLIKKTGTLALTAFLVLPASTTYSLHDYGFGGGSVGNADSSTYSLNAIAGEVSGQKLSGATYDLGPGLTFARQANTPAAPTFTNPASYYNRLHFVLDTGGNPSDATYAIAISSDDFATTNYIQADGTVGATPVYQTYTTWGGASGAYVIGLTSNTTYKIKVKVLHGKFTESSFSAIATAATSVSSLSYDIDVSSSDTETGAPYILTVGQLTPGTVTTATTKIWVDIDTNAEGGGFVFVYDANAGLRSTNVNYTIASLTGDLSAQPEGMGLQSSTTAQSSGGPITAVAPYNGSSHTVGVLSTSSQTIFSTGSAAVVGGRASIVLKAKASTTTPAASDYADTVTLIASGTY